MTPAEGRAVDKLLTQIASLLRSTAKDLKEGQSPVAIALVLLQTAKEIERTRDGDY